MAKINQLPPLAPVREVALITEEVAELIGVGGDGGQESEPGGEGADAGTGTGVQSGAGAGATPKDEE
jgi:hypothetical protein